MTSPADSSSQQPCCPYKYAQLTCTHDILHGHIDVLCDYDMDTQSQLSKCVVTVVGMCSPAMFAIAVSFHVSSLLHIRVPKKARIIPIPCNYAYMRPHELSLTVNQRCQVRSSASDRKSQVKGSIPQCRLLLDWSLLECGRVASSDKHPLCVAAAMGLTSAGHCWRRDVDMLHLATNIRYVFACHNWIDKRCKNQRVLDLELVQPPPVQSQDWRVTQVLPQYTRATSPFRPRYSKRTSGRSNCTSFFCLVHANFCRLAQKHLTERKGWG